LSERSLTEDVSAKLWYLIITGGVLVLDQLTKYWAAAALRSGGEIIVIRGLVSFNYTENSGIAFGMLNDGNVKWPLVAISTAAISLVLFYMMRTEASNRLLLVALSLLAAGISGNLIDRIRMGSVIDFIEVYYKTFRWPVFNIADTAISIGAALLAIDLFLAPRQAKTELAEPAQEERG
jgi:signal peptidase II